MRLAQTAAVRPLMASAFTQSEDPEVKRAAQASRSQVQPGGGSVSSDGWPFFPAQCPQCVHFERAAQPCRDDSGDETVGFCRHPRIAAKLMRLRRRAPGSTLWCRLFLPSSRAEGSAARGR